MQSQESLLGLLLSFLVSVYCEKSKVVLISMDGFRYDYLKKTSNVPYFKKLLQSGVTMPYMNSPFVTKTFPCQYTIATGLYPESHGIISNTMYDPVLNKYFSMSNTDTEWWDGGEPIWITAVKGKLKSGVYFWAGSEVRIQNLTATIWMPYNISTPYEVRISTAVQWLAKNNFDLVVLYFNEPDNTGHEYGPDSPQVVQAIERMDGVIGQLLDGLEREDLKDKVNIIVTSDHGMATVDLDTKLLDISEKVNISLLQSVVDDGPDSNLIPQPNKAKELVEALSNVDHLHVMLKEDIPEKFHLKNNRRVMPVFAYADEGWLITNNATKRRQSKYYGDHGYDNELINMKPFFIASGPDFKTGGHLVDPIQSVDIYPLICHLLGITASPNNGSLVRAQQLLRSDAITKIISQITVCLCFTFSMLFH